MVPKFYFKYIVLRYDKDYCVWQHVDAFDAVPSGDKVLAGDIIFERKYEVKQDPAPTPYLVEVYT